MVFFNYALRKLNAKIVYYGPGLCGKTTNLQWIHDHFEGGQRGKMISLATEGDRTIFFDLLPIDIGTIRGMDVTLQLYTVPGQVHYNSTRQLVLRGADGVVFVADSQRTMRESNVESFENLQENLMLQGIELKGFPHVLQFNKRDLRDLLSTEDINESLNFYSVPIFEGVATQGIGVQETLEGIVKLVMRNLREKYEPVASASGPKAPAPMKVTGPMPVSTPPSPVPRPATPPPQPSPPPAPAPAPPPVEPEEPPMAAASFELPSVEVPDDEPTPVAESSHDAMDDSDSMDDIDFGSAFSGHKDEDEISTRVYEDAEETEPEPGPPWGFETDYEDEGPEAVFAVDREPSGEPDEDEEDFSGLFTDPRDEEVSVPDELPPPQVFVPETPAAEPEPEPIVADSAPDVDFGLPIRESMDDLFAPEEPEVEPAARGAASEENDRYVDRIEAPGPFAPPPSRPAAASAEPPAAAGEEEEEDVDVRVLQALGASEDREALASLTADQGDDRLAPPPEAKPVAPPPPEQAPAPPPRPKPAAGPSDTIDLGDDFVEPKPPRVRQPEAPATVPPKPKVVPPPVAPSVPPPTPPTTRADRMSKSQPIMVGDGDPFTADEAGVIPDVVRASAKLVPGKRSFDLAADGNQLHLALRGSGAIAEMGQVRALDIEVPVPGQWVGNRKVTLQLRLTLTPAEEENG